MGKIIGERPPLPEGVAQLRITQHSVHEGEKWSYVLHLPRTLAEMLAGIAEGMAGDGYAVFLDSAHTDDDVEFVNSRSRNSYKDALGFYVPAGGLKVLEGIDCPEAFEEVFHKGKGLAQCGCKDSLDYLHNPRKLCVPPGHTQALRRGTVYGVTGALLPVDYEVVGYNPEWVHVDTNPDGRRACVYRGHLAGWVSARWDNDTGVYFSTGEAPVEFMVP